MSLQYAWDFGDISEEEVVEALRIGLGCARRDGRVAFWELIPHFLPIFVKLRGNASELWRKIQVVEEVWEHIISSAHT